MKGYKSSIRLKGEPEIQPSVVDSKERKKEYDREYRRKNSTTLKS